MKKILSVALFAVCFMNSHAQEAQAGDFNIGITAGGGLSIDRINVETVTNRHPIANIQGGATFDYAFVDNMFLEAGLTLQRKGMRSVIEADKYYFESKFKQSRLYLEAPITYNYRINAGSIGIIPQIGPYFALGIYGKSKEDMGGLRPSMVDSLVGGPKVGRVYREWNPFHKEDSSLRRFDFGTRFGLGLAFSKKIKLTIGYDMGVISITSNKYNESNYTIRNYTNSWFGTVTYYFKKGSLKKN